MVPATEMHRDERRPRFDETPREQCALTPTVPSITITQSRVFLPEIERTTGGGTGHQIECLPVEAVHRIEHTRTFRVATKPIKSFGQRGAIIQPLHRHAARHLNVLHAEVRGIRITIGLERVVSRSDIVRSEVARPESNAGRIRHRDIRRHSALSRSRYFRCDRPDKRRLARCVRTTRAATSRQHQVPARKVIAVVVVERTNQRELVGALGLKWEQLANLEALDVRLDRIPEASILGRSLWLEVVQVEVTRPTIEPDQDDRRVLRRSPLLDRSLFRTQDMRQTGQPHPCHSNLKEAPARHPIAVTTSRTEIESEHGKPFQTEKFVSQTAGVIASKSAATTILKSGRQ